MDATLPQTVALTGMPAERLVVGRYERPVDQIFEAAIEVIRFNGAIESENSINHPSLDGLIRVKYVYKFRKRAPLSPASRFSPERRMDALMWIWPVRLRNKLLAIDAVTPPYRGVIRQSRCSIVTYD